MIEQEGPSGNEKKIRLSEIWQKKSLSNSVIIAYAKKWNVANSPTLLIAPEKYSIRWLGAPMGEEARTFLELLILVGLGQSQLSDQSLKIIEKIDSPRNVKIFVSPTCPYCPQQAVNAVKAAIELPEYVTKS